MDEFYDTCKNILNLKIIGLMCIPPINQASSIYFEKMSQIAKNFSLEEISMGMSEDFIDAIKYKATFVRVGSKIFGNRG